MRRYLKPHSHIFCSFKKSTNTFQKQWADNCPNIFKKCLLKIWESSRKLNSYTVDVNTVDNIWKSGLCNRSWVIMPASWKTEAPWLEPHCGNCWLFTRHTQTEKFYLCDVKLPIKMIFFLIIRLILTKWKLKNSEAICYKTEI